MMEWTSLKLIEENDGGKHLGYPPSTVDLLGFNSFDTGLDDDLGLRLAYQKKKRICQAKESTCGILLVHLMYGTFPMV